MAKPITITLLGDESDLADSLERSATDVTHFADQVEEALRQATEQAGGLGDAVADGIADAGDEVGSFGDRFGGAAALAGAAIAGGLVAGINEALNQEKSNDLLAAQLGANPAEAQRLGKAAGEIYSSGWGESVEDANAALKALWQEGLVPADATADELADVGRRAMDVANVLGDEVGPTSNAVSNMIKTGLARNAREAFDIMTAGAQNGANKAEDLADVFNEYSTNFRTMGLDGATAMGLVSQGLKGGARDADQVADAIKEFSLVAGQGGKAVEETFNSIGLNGSQIVKDVAAGGDSAKMAMDKVLDALREMPASAERASVVKTLFGGPGEDLGAALFSLNVDTAAKSLGKVEGAAKRAGDTMHDNASTKLSAFWRTLQHGAVNVVGGAVLPALEELIDVSVALGGFIADNKVPITAVAALITILLLPALIAWGTTATTSAVANGIAWVTSSATATTGAATQVLAHWAVVGGWVKAAAQAVISGGIVVAGWIAMGAQALAQGARMAAAWLIAMGPVALVIAAVVGLVALIVANWDTIVGATTQAWDWVWNKIKTAFGWLVSLFLNFTGPGLLLKHWDTIKRTAADAFSFVYDKARNGLNSVVSFFTSLPGRIGSAAGSVARAALGVGGSVVDGLKNGLSRLGGFASSLTSAVSGATKGAVNGVVDLLNWAIPNRLGMGPLSIDIPDNPIPRVRAMGGPAQGLTRVGERGPEWVQLPGGSNVIPNHAAPGGGVVVNVRSEADPWAIGREVAWALRTA
ncbi:phage tail tape measure protein [Streptomyces sp. SID1121]|uniref:phage tail tape measure protein n=1 Tax=Streptomyces sp. SID1121 TaxID=3425888 RepID=UPI0040574E98